MINATYDLCHTWGSYAVSVMYSVNHIEVLIGGYAFAFLNLISSVTALLFLLVTSGLYT